MKPWEEEAGTEQPFSFPLWWQYLLVQGVIKRNMFFGLATCCALVLMKPRLLYMAVFLVAQVSIGPLQNATCFVEVEVGGQPQSGNQTEASDLRELVSWSTGVFSV